MPQLVSPDNFARAESDLYFAKLVSDGSFATLQHTRELSPLDKQMVIRQNRDTLYSSGGFDLDAGPATVTLPDSAGRFMSLQVISEDHYTTEVAYAPATVTLTRDQVGTRYVATAIRTLVDPDDPADLAAVHALQDAVAVVQEAPGSFVVPDWDPVSQKTVRDALVTLATTLPDTKGMFGTAADTDPVRHLIGSANAWGGNPERDAFYLTVVPSQNDGTTVHRLTVKDVPVDGFWSVTVYNKDGYFTANEQNAYSLNNITATKDPDGSTTIQFGGTGADNLLPITPGWNYTVRLYRPRPEILDGSWTFPAAEPV
ncbi:carboxylesterase [Mycolicibacterium mucogenicum]|uniref:Carboxylesterase n=1 Tax=Mycolicibacterium mucogenicum TaxID=56689 RepID=A0A1A0MYG2_MYCMU|nr:carboxylesterase [Mycolicibacterium mucogenicum]